MRVILVTQGITPMVKAFLASNHTVVGIVEGAPRKAPPSVPDRPSPLARFAGRQRIPYFWLHRKNGDELARWTTALEPDLGAIYSLSQLLKPAVIDAFPRGMINLHPSLLPAYRGPNPYFWAFFDEAEALGVTVHYIDVGEDTGDIISQHILPNEPGLTYDQAVRTTLVEGTCLLVEAADAIEEGRALRIQQPEASTTRRARRISVDAVMEMLEWETWPIERVWRFVCGAAPWLRVKTKTGSTVALDQFRVLGFRPPSDPPPATVYLEGRTPFCRLRHPQGDLLLAPNQRFLKRRLRALLGR